MSGPSGSNGESVSRRRIIQAMGAASAASLAGCLGDDGDTGDSDTGDSDTGDSDTGDSDTGDSDTGDSDMELGERFPEPLLVEYWSDGSATASVEAFAPVIIENYQNLLDTTVEYVPVEFTTQINNVVDDVRSHHVAQWWHSSTPSRLDPQEMHRRYSVDWAGGNGRGNPINYANCEYSEYAVGQGQAPSQENRQTLVEGAQAVQTQQYVQQPIIARVFYGAWNPETVNVPEEAIGNMGLNRTNPFSMIHTEPVEDDYTYSVVGYAGVIETTNYPIHDSSSANGFWNTIYTSPLFGYSVNYDLRGVLGESFESSNNGQTYTITIKDDATFHNGDDVTAEDVKFTYEQLWINGVGAYPQSTSPPVDSIEVLGDKEVEFNFNVPYPSLISREFPRWGVMHAESWQDAVDDPEGFLPDPTEVPGAGPFRIVDYGLDEFISLEPYEDHVFYDVDHSFSVEIIRDQTAQAQAMLAGEIDLILETSIGSIENMQNENPDIKSNGTPGFTPFIIYPQWPRAPSKFAEFRRAIQLSVDRATANEVAMRNNSLELMKGFVLAPNHPNYPEDDSFLVDQAPDASGDVEAGRQVLQDAGWGWDDDGNLRYPADKDLAPRWPAEEEPDPSNYPCLNSEGEFEGQMSQEDLLSNVSDIKARGPMLER